MASDDTAPDLSRLRTLALRLDGYHARISPEELRYLLGAVDELAQLREAAGALVDTLALGGGACPCGACYALATVGEPLPRGGSIFRCDKHASPPDPGDDAPPPYATKAAAPLRALRRLLPKAEG